MPAAPQPACTRTITADVVAIPHAIMLNRLGASVPDGLVFALKKDTVETQYGRQLRKHKRARPIVLRANVGDCLTITFTNAVPGSRFTSTKMPGAKTGTKEVSLHIQGVEWVQGPQDDGSFVGVNNSSLASPTPSPSPAPSPMPPQTLTYSVYAAQEGTFLLYTMGDTSTQGSQLARGLFGALNVQPKLAEWYRSQVTADDLQQATYNANKPDHVPPGSLNCTTPTNCTFNVNGNVINVLKTPGGLLNTPDNHPLINYNAKYQDGTPILKILDGTKIVHSDLTAIITGPNAGRFPGTTGPNNPEPPCNAKDNSNPAVDPLFCANPASPDRKQPYREVTIIYHEVLNPITQQAFPIFTDPVTETKAGNGTVAAGKDAFAINYGTGGIAAEVYANRIGVGPMGDCVDCKFEEFFLSAWAVGDAAMLVDRPANSNMQAPCTTTASFNTPPCGGQRSSATEPYTLKPTVKAKAAFFPDDPSNTYHSYINDHLKFRILHGGTGVTHVHHQHAHQWLQSPNSDQGSYLDSQMISPGASYTLEMVYNGSGNRNKVVGDSIFHCHFYPHFAAGMWAMWRTHDTFESGTFVYPSGKVLNGVNVGDQVVPGARALPDGEIIAGVPTPAVVPMPTLPMAPLPAYAQIKTNVKVHGADTHFGGQVVIGGECQNNKINGMDVIGGCTNGEHLNGTVINSRFDGTNLMGQFQKSANNAIENPGFPYFIPGIAGARAPHPPLDFAPDGAGGFLDGGLPRHLISGGSISYERHTPFDWSKDLETMNAVQLPEDGTAVEKAAIAFFENRCYATFRPDGTAGSCPSSNSTPPQSTLNTPPTGFVLNGLPNGPQSGAPFADPAIDDNGNAIGTKRVYKAAAIQLNVVYNKSQPVPPTGQKPLAWHFPQHRMLTLWKDVQPSIDFSFGKPGRAPEPLFFRGNSNDIIEYWHTNLVPNYYVVDDFQVRTPTDILGQHIHLVKFDVTSSDGAGNGFNYEDGTFSPQEVQDTIRAINKAGGILVGGVKQMLPDAKLPPSDILDCAANPTDPRCQLCPDNWTVNSRPICPSWRGAQTTIQRWFIDPLVDNQDVDRTMRTVFTHDHFGPSTHQQAGLYAGLVIEPLNSTWRNSETGVMMGSRMDGGPTSWKADIWAKDSQNRDVSYREFVLEFQDFQLAYQVKKLPNKAPALFPDATSVPNPNPSMGYRNRSYAVGPPSGTNKPTLVSTAGTLGTQTINYRNEPLPYRIGTGDPSKAFDSSVVQPGSIPGMSGDPFTPQLRAYQGDNTQIRLLVGAHMFAHQFNLLGPTWFAEPSWKNSGYRTAQPMGLSEHFELLFQVPSSSAASTGRKCPDNMSDANCTDYLYSASMDEFGLANGMWGLFRAYSPTAEAKQLKPLPNNPVGPTAKVDYMTCPSPLPAPGIKRTFRVTAVTAQKALALRTPVFPATSPAKGTLVFNDRGGPSKQLNNPNGLLYVRSEDLDGQGRLKDGAPIEPLILRANAGDCIEVELTNALSYGSDVFLDKNLTYAQPLGTMVPIKLAPSMSVGLQPQLLSYDALTSAGTNIGFNSKNQTDQLVKFGETKKYQWYAGKIERDATGNLNHTPVEFGTLNLIPSDPLFQNINGLFGSMVIEPEGSSWRCDAKDSNGNMIQVDCDDASSVSRNVTNPPQGADSSTTASASVQDPISFTRASATVTPKDATKQFREFVVMISDSINIFQGSTSATTSSVNYRTEPKNFRYAGNSTQDFSCMLSNQLIAAPVKDPQTPIFTANPGDAVRFRMAHPFGTGTSQVFTVHGHAWQRNPFQTDSREIGNNSLSQWLGSRDNHGSTDHFELVLGKAGGDREKQGDYLYGVFHPSQIRLGAWGLFRVGSSNQPLQPNAQCVPVPAPSRVLPIVEDPDLERFLRTPVNKNAKP
ncbi:MAG TPA: hypothetical protein VJM12_11870 [Pyrinomonadaceae bacterium]|nr:hypothetical protein [Pyrinomonadaceae bacterium]